MPGMLCHHPSLCHTPVYSRAARDADIAVSTASALRIFFDGAPLTMSDPGPLLLARGLLPVLERLRVAHAGTHADEPLDSLLGALVRITTG